MRNEGVFEMTASERVLAIRLMEKQRKNPEYFEQLAFKAIGLALSLTWGAAKILASLLFAIAVPVLIVCLLFAGGVILLLPLALIGGAVGLLKACT